MNTTPSASDAEPPLIQSRSGFADAVAWAVRSLSAVDARRMVWCSERFDDWPLDDPALLEQLTAWLRLPQRRLVMLGRQFDSIRRHQPRFIAWRRDWAHAQEAWTPPAEMGELPTLLVTDRAITVQLIDSVHWRGRASVDERRAYQLREQIDAFQQRSEAAFPVHQLGL